MQSITPRKLLIIDGLGALLSSALLLGVLRPLHQWIGLPEDQVELLGRIALILAFYSFSVFFSFKKPNRRFIRMLGIFNLFYVLFTLSLLIQYHENMKVYGWAYFSGELILVLFLVYLEWTTASKSREIQT